MTSLSEQLESTRERITKEQKRLVVGAERTRRALSRAAREEAASWQLYVSTERRRVTEAASASLALLRSRTGIERAVLRAADRTLLDVHAQVKQRLSRIDRELTADAMPSIVVTAPEPTPDLPASEPVAEPAEKRVRARRPSRKSH